MFGRAAAALLAPLAVGCVPTTWDAAALERAEPALRESGAGRLGDSTPYLLPAQGTVTWFLCRWPDAAPIPVSLPEDAAAAERELLERALRSWEGAVPGLRFGPAGPPGRGIEIRFVEEPETDAPIRRTADTIADCAVVSDAPDADRLAAQLVFASIHLRRAQHDALGREQPLLPDQLLGSVLHELGHALGFQGHVARGSSVLSRSVDTVQRVGRRVLAGHPLEAPAVRALYAVASGRVVARSRVAAARTRPFDAMQALARSRDLSGPFVRVGDRLARMAWLPGSGPPYIIWVPDVAAVLADPDRLVGVPSSQTAAALGDASASRRRE